jgi:hypothetical protein
VAYDATYYANLINQYKDTQPELAFAIFNGASGMGGGMGAGFDPGALDEALRNLWGPDAAKQWVNAGTQNYGNAMFDPKTGQYGYYKNGAISSGTLGGYDPTQFDPANIKAPTSMNYDPTRLGSNLPGGVTTLPPVGTGAGPKTTSTTPAPTTTGGRTVNSTTPPPTNLSTLSRTSAITPNPLGVSNLPAAAHGPITNSTDPTQVGTENDPNNMVRTRNTNEPPGYSEIPPPGTVSSTPTGGTHPTTPPPGATPPPPAVTTQPPLVNPTNPATPKVDAPPPGSTAPPPATTAPPVGGPNSVTGDTGDTPRANAASWSTPTNVTAPFNFEADPGYAFRKKEGIDKIEQSAASGGRLLSGATLKDLATFNSGLASQEYDKAYGRYDTDRKFGEATATDERNYNNENRKWDTNFNESQRRDARDFDWAQTKDQRDFATALAEWNDKFGYDVQHTEQQDQMNTLLSMAKMGLLSETQMAQLSTELTRQVNSNNLTGAGANAASTVGGAGDINNLLGQISTYISRLNTVPKN